MAEEYSFWDVARILVQLGHECTKPIFLIFHIHCRFFAPGEGGGARCMIDGWGAKDDLLEDCASPCLQ